MPTGFTQLINDGVDFKTFVMRCSRAMGALIMMRDDPDDAKIPERFEPNGYHLREGEKAHKELTRLKSLTTKQIKSEINKEFRAAINQREKRTIDIAKQRAGYEKTLLKVKEWQPPSPEHVEFKGFMIQQIESSIEFDCKIYNENIEKLSPELWISTKITKCLRDIEYHGKKNDLEISMTESRNIWISRLRKSLENY